MNGRPAMPLISRARRLVWSVIFRSGIAALLPDRLFTSIEYWCYTGRRLDLQRPVDFNQKVQWLKLFCRNPLYVTCADKYEVRKYVKAKIGAQYLNECIGVYDKVEDIVFNELPSRFAIKATHGSGWNLICKDKSQFDWAAACKVMRKWMRSDFSKVGREWQYHRIQPRIVIEAFMEEPDGTPLRDYKLFTFEGETKYVAVEFDKKDGLHYLNIYDAEGRFQTDKKIGNRNDPSYIKALPPCWFKMQSLAHALAEDFPMCRVDFYVLGGRRVIFGEMTFTPGKGCNSISPQTFCDEMGSYINLPKHILTK